MFKPVFDYEDCKEYLSKTIDVVIVGKSNEQRCSYIKRKFDNEITEIIEIEVENIQENDNLKIKSNIGYFSNEKQWPFYHGLQRMLKKADIQKRNLLVDITGIQPNIIYYLVKLLINQFPPKLLFCSYTEPDEYNRIEEDQYLLHEEVFGLQSLPGFAKLPDLDGDKILIAFLGFEGERLLKIIEEQYSDAIVYPVISFPAYKAYWQYIALRKNYESLNNINYYKNIAYYDPRDPIDTMSVIKKIYNENFKKNVLITSLGTKPTILGIALSASSNEHIHPLCDYPLESEKKSTGIGRVSIYPVSKYSI